ncbi:R3H domain-containing protein 2 [Senna tora]|uniref:R3H domain-containing protein 2 n=1 Tax=Senna tora TaxID=362788 RepID=A0A834SH62_9FABA|nr:R3H domain-containing protein 2 [Senna tora]
MDSSSVSVDGSSGLKNKESMVDPFLVEALQNFRHRLTILRMEFDIQRFLNNADQQHFEFQHYPSSYLRLAAHRVAQHYGMQTMVQDGLDGQASKIVVRKLAESRPCKTNVNETNEAGRIENLMRSVEERKEEYDRARARIFSSSGSSDLGDALSRIPVDGRNSCTSKEENEIIRNSVSDSEKYTSVRDMGSTRVAIFRDREKDRSDPDYDRSYGRYARSTPTSAPNLVPYNLPKVQPSFPQYDAAFNQIGHMSQTQAPLGYVPPSSPIMTPFSATGLNQLSGDAAYLQWPSPAMMYAHSYDQFRHAVFQAPFGQQPLSFDYSQNY